MVVGVAICNSQKWVPHGVEVECWLCNPRVSGLIPGHHDLIFDKIMKLLNDSIVRHKGVKYFLTIFWIVFLKIVRSVLCTT